MGSSRLLSLLVCFGLGLQAVQATDYCLNLYRRDLCQTWSVKQGEPLCTLQGPIPASSGSQTPSSVTVSVIDSQDFFISTSYTDQSKLSYNYYSTYGDLGGEFGIALWRDKTSGGIVLRLTPSPSQTLYATSDSNDGFGAYVRYTVFTQLEKTSGSFNPQLNLAILVLNLIGAVVLIYVLKTAVIGLVWLLVYPILVGLLQANIKLDNTALFLVVCALANGIAFSAGYFAAKQDKSKQLNIVLGCTAFAGIFMIVGNPSGYALGTLYIVPAFILVGSTLACSRCLLQFADGTPNKTEAVSVFSYSMVFAMDLFYFAYGFPAIQWLTIQEGLHNYVRGSNTDGLGLIFLIVVYLVLTSILFGVVSCYYNRKPATFFNGHEAGAGIEYANTGNINEYPGPLYS